MIVLRIRGIETHIVFVAYITRRDAHPDVHAMPSRSETNCGSTIMADLAILTDILCPGVIPSRRNPRAGTVTLVASGRGCDVARWFVGSSTPVVTGVALPWHHSTMIETRPQECEGIEMAVLARCIGHQMTIRLGGRQAALTHGMTPAAISRRTFEYPSRVAGIATGRGMAAGKRKAGGHMIEGDFIRRFFR
jgi:hypothetical protein